MITRRGRYVSTYLALTDDADFVRLSSDAKLVFWTLKHWPEGNQLGVFRCYVEALEDRTGLPADRCENALAELERSRWIFTDGRLIWIRNHLRFDLGMNWNNPKHVKGVIRMLDGLPKSRLIQQFADYYHGIGLLTEWHPQTNEKASECQSAGVLPNTNTETNTETNYNTPLTPPAGGKPARAGRSRRRKAAHDTDVIPEARAGCEDHARISGRAVDYSASKLALFARLHREGRTRAEWCRVLEALRDRSVPAAAFARDGDGTREGPGPGLSWAMRPGTGPEGGFDKILLQLDELGDQLSGGAAAVTDGYPSPQELEELDALGDRLARAARS